MVLLDFRGIGNLEETARLPGGPGGLVETSETWSDIASDHGLWDILGMDAFCNFLTRRNKH